MREFANMRINYDTVEEFWSKEDVGKAYIAANESSYDRFLREFSRFLDVPKVNLSVAHSGKLALERLLSSMKSKNRIVKVCALNCVRVRSAIEDAGCEVSLYDFADSAGMFDWESILTSNKSEIGALIVTHYYGVPANFDVALEICKKRDIVLIEDCAQTLGGKISGRQVGTLGDAAIFSFSYDKPISLGWGGISIINSEEKFEKNKIVSTYSYDPSLSGEISEFQEFMRLLNKRRSRISANKISFSIIIDRVFKSKNLSALYKCDLGFKEFQAELGIFCLKKYRSVQRIRNSNSNLFAKRSSFRTWPVTSDNIEPAWLKQKIFVEDTKLVTEISRSLKRMGFRVGNFNWPYTLESKKSKDCDISDQVANKWLDIPIHQNLDEEGIIRMVEKINRYV